MTGHHCCVCRFHSKKACCGNVIDLCICRVLAAKLQALTDELVNGKLTLHTTQHVTTFSTLALFLSYLQFAALGESFLARRGFKQSLLTDEQDR